MTRPPMLAADHIRAGCTVPTCDRPARRLGYCNAHLRRLERTGDVQAHKPLRHAPAADERDDITARILAQTITTDTGCIIWTGLLDAAGYGRIGWQGRMWATHRAIWTHQVGPIPTGKAPDGSEWTLDHLCFQRPCVNIAHLEVVSRIENSRRAGGLDVAHVVNRGTKAGHGTTARYRYGCRCPGCRRAHADATRARRATKGATK